MLYPVCVELGLRQKYPKAGLFCDIETFSKIRIIRYTLYSRISLYPVVFAKSGNGCVIVEVDSLATLTALTILQGTLYPVYVTVYKAYEICHFDGLKNVSAIVYVFAD